MTGKLKPLGALLLVTLALLAFTASAASAANYTASSYPTTGKGSSPRGNGVFTTEAGKVECITHYEETLIAASANMLVIVTATECIAFGFVSATVSMGSCSHLLKSPTGSADSYTAAMEVKCTNAAEPITITAGNCEATVGEQAPTGSVAITNETAAGDIKVKANVTGIKYTVTKDGSLCPFNGTGAKTGASFVHNSAVTIDSTNGATIDVG